MEFFRPTQHPAQRQHKKFHEISNPRCAAPFIARRSQSPGGRTEHAGRAAKGAAAKQRRQGPNRRRRRAARSKRSRSPEGAIYCGEADGAGQSRREPRPTAARPALRRQPRNSLGAQRLRGGEAERLRKAGVQALIAPTAKPGTDKRPHPPLKSVSAWALKGREGGGG